MSTQVSPAVVWDSLRNGSCFAVHRDGAHLSREALNVKGVHSFKFSGLAQPKGLGIVTGTKTKKGRKSKVTITLLSKTGSTVGPVGTGLNGSASAAVKAINTVAAVGYYRPDLRAAALGKYAAVSKTKRAIKAAAAARKPRRA